MATNRNGYLGPFSGKLGPAMGSVWRGIQVIKTLPAPSNKPPTAKQLDQHAKFGLVTDFLGKLSSYIKRVFQSYTMGVTPMNVAVKYHLEKAVSGVYPLYEINYPNVLLTDPNSDGIDELLNPVLTALPMHKIKIDWDTENFRPETKATDKLTVVFYSEAKDVIMGTALTPARTDKTMTFTSSRQFAAAPVHGWGYFVSDDGKIVSPTVYLGSIQTIDA
ncbi:DUF6266 family protein [Pedobacter sp. BAL39]|uniref:DUF6266 family protein n=1 Tax=Pedobacter sp. BAL39 TaxID=391596 RepID=UPI0002D567EA|nr:DUF6266 family protein [Pedobacter sp. BAL39]